MARKARSRVKVTENDKATKNDKKERSCADELKATLEARSIAKSIAIAADELKAALEAILITKSIVIADRNECESLEDLERTSITIAERNARESMLFSKLSGELLNIIYRHVVVSDETIELHLDGEHAMSLIDHAGCEIMLGKQGQLALLDCAPNPSITLVCRRLYEEVLPIYLTENDFSFVMDPTDDTCGTITRVYPLEIRMYRQLLRNSVVNAASEVKEMRFSAFAFKSRHHWEGSVHFTAVPSSHSGGVTLALTHYGAHEYVGVEAGKVKLCSCWFKKWAKNTGTPLLDLVEVYIVELNEHLDNRRWYMPVFPAPGAGPSCRRCVVCMGAHFGRS